METNRDIKNHLGGEDLAEGYRLYLARSMPGRDEVKLLL